jgi:hypothetical protein
MDTNVSGTDVKRRYVRSCVHGRPRHCTRCVNRKRLISRLLDELIADLYPPKLAQPSTFGLTSAELCAEARRLRREGWTRGEVTTVLAVDPACTEVA